MTSRAQFLGHVRAEMAKTRGLFPATVAQRPVDPAEAAAMIMRQLAERWPEALDRFKVEFELVAGLFHHVRTLDDVPEVIGQIARER